MKRELKEKGLLAALSILFFVILYWRFIGGDIAYLYADIGSDTMDQYYPMYCDIVRKLQNGTLSLWNWNYGLGTELFATQQWIMDPAALLIFAVGFLGGTGSILPMLLITQLIKILLCGFGMYEYLKGFHYSGLPRFMASFAYAYNPFLMLWGQHYHFGAICVYLIWTLVLLEHFLTLCREDDGICKTDYRASQKRAAFTFSKNGTLLLYALLIALTCAYSVYLCYMSLLFIVFYAVLRYLYSCWSSIKNLLRDAGMACAATICGIMMAGFWLLTFYDTNINTSARVGADSVSDLIRQNLQLYSLQELVQILSRLIANNSFHSREIGAAYYELPQLAVAAAGGVFLVTAGIWHLAVVEKSKRQRNLLLISAGLIVFLIFIPLGSSVMNGLQYSFGRYSYVLLPVMTLLYAEGWRMLRGAEKDESSDEKCSIRSNAKAYDLQVSTLPAGLLMIEVLLMGAVLFGGAGNDSTYSLALCYRVLLIGINIVMAAVIILCKPHHQRRCTILCVLLVLIGTLSDHYMSINAREKASVNEEKSSNTEKVLAQIAQNDDSFYRIEKSFTVLTKWGDSVYLGYPSATGYVANLNSNLAEFYGTIWPDAEITDDFRYTCAQDYITADKKNQNQILTLLGVKYLITDAPLDTGNEDAFVLTDMGNGIGGSNGDSYYVYRNRNTDGILSVYHKVISTSAYEELGQEDRQSVLSDCLVLADEEAEGSGLSVDCMTAGGKTSSESPAENEKASAKVSDDADGLGESESERTGMDAHYTVQKTINDHFHSVVTADEECYAMLSIPYRTGWRVMVNGKECAVVKADYGFCAVQLEPGENEIEFYYDNPYYKTGAILSLIGVVMWLGGILYEVGWKRRFRKS